MSAFAVQMPSVQANGDPIAVGTGATTVHTAVSGTSQADEVWLWVGNMHATADVDVTVEINAIPFLKQTLVCKSQLQLVLPGVRVNNAHVVKVTASAASSAVALVNVNRITL